MNFFTVYTNPSYPDQIKLVPEGFSWLVLVLGAIGLLLQKSWIHGLIFLSIYCSLRFWLHPPFVILLIFHFGMACFAYQFKRTELQLSGWKIKTVITGKNKQSALLRLLDRHPDLQQKIYI
ncbi:hypothetical protein [Commensalibacter oyaizuii]|uniref:DUF2628 domain-containing protein n=1 Tax=Commensalibacter oyaizuii TaxID=3043873 RepID=A0ABT6Q074_9PROT|nr:hypothetical protein [Commensalibacter sp. TBRC 16381]MDI2090503.1 hypothetical protein [Commensalibacter sp. TBRC 16381]